MFLYNQSELTIFAKSFVKRAVPLLLTYNLLPFREELIMLLLPIKRIPFPLHRLSSFLLSSLISSSRFWSSQWMILDKTISVSSFTSFSLITFTTFPIFCEVLTLFLLSFVPEWITGFCHFRFFPGSWSYVINKVFGCCTRMASNFNWTRLWYFPTIHVFYHGITYDYTIFLRNFVSLTSYLSLF